MSEKGKINSKIKTSETVSYNVLKTRKRKKNQWQSKEKWPCCPVVNWMKVIFNGGSIKAHNNECLTK